MQDQIMDAVSQKHVQLNSDASSLNMEALPNGKANETRFVLFSISFRNCSEKYAVRENVDDLIVWSDARVRRVI